MLYDANDLQDYYFRFAGQRLSEGCDTVVDFSCDDDDSVINYVATAGGRYDCRAIDINKLHSWKSYKDLVVIPKLELTHLKTQHTETFETSLKELESELGGEEYTEAAICVLVKGLRDVVNSIEIPVGSGKVSVLGA